MKPPSESALPPARSGGRQILPLTALRGLAAWWVVFYHFDLYLFPYLPSWATYFASKGYLAVDLFFCLSGFVIFFNYGHLKSTHAQDVFKFYVKRWAKIYPLHLFTIGLYCLLLSVLLLSHETIPAERFSLGGFLANIFLVQDWGTAAPALNWNIPAWSISAEFAAYLLFPLIVVAVRKAGGRLFAGLVSIFCLVCLLNVFYAHQNFHLGRAINTLGVLRCVVQFGVGALLARLYLEKRFDNLLAGFTFVALAAVLFAAGLWRWESVLIPLAWTALVFGLACGNRHWPILNQPILVWLGEISYATYMIHYFVRDLFKLALVHAGQVTPLSYVLLALLAVLGASVPLYFWLERPAQKYLTRKVTLKAVAPAPHGQVA